MIAVSDAWKDIQPRNILPESYIEIDCSITDLEAQNVATVEGLDEAVFSNSGDILDDKQPTIKYATNELNFWALDGSRVILPDYAPDASTGYVSRITSVGGVTLKFPEVRTKESAGVTITWGGRYDEYPLAFTVVARNGSTIVKEAKVTGNTSQVSVVFATLKDYDSISITVDGWCLPHRRVRIEKVIVGHVMTFTKEDIFSFTHEQTGHLNSGDLPKNSISFSLDNTDGKWNPNAPEGLGQYLSERQKMKVRYGLDVDGTIEWIKAGTFYLSEWKVPSNGLEASFVARDILEYLMNETYTGGRRGTLYQLIADAFESAGVPDDINIDLDTSLKDISTTLPQNEFTCAEVVQMCANAGGCVAFQDREGAFHVKPLDKTISGYVIPLELSYTHPEIELSKPLKSVSVAYGENGTHTLSVGGSGETQTVNNPLVVSEAQASTIANWVRRTLSTRQVVRGEYRADPRLDVFDIVEVASKYGNLYNVAITDIKYSFNGSFRGNYTGRVLEGGE